MGATVGAAAGADSLDDPHAAVNSAKKTALVSTVSSIDRRRGALFSCAEFRCHRINSRVRSNGFALPAEPESETSQPRPINATLF